jgi:predicted DNA-binding transcriptional regulator AlpA
MSAKSHIRDLGLVGLEPRGLSREQAAAYVGISPTKFDQLVADGRMPKPKRVDARTIWDRRQVDVSFDALTDASRIGGEQNPWNDVAN